MRVEFNLAGRWSTSPSEPQFEVKAKEIRDVPAHLAEFVVNTGQGVIVQETTEKVVAMETTEAPIVKPKRKRGRPRKVKVDPK